MKSNDIKRVIDEGLADVKMTEQNMDAVMRRIQEAQERPTLRIRKIQVAVIVALVLLLISTVAIATMSLLGVFERSFEIQKEEDSELINDWSFEHQMELVELLTNAGAELNEEKISLLYADELSEGEKGELVVEILLEHYDLEGDWIDSLSMLMGEKGPIEYWTHEERAWLSEQLNVTLEHVGDMRFLVPTESDLSEEEAYAIAYKYYEETLGLGRECFDEMQQIASFSDMLNEDCTITRSWRLTLTLNIDHYDGKALAWNALTIDVSNEGDITYADDLTFRTWRDDWYDTFMAENFWTIEGLCAFKEEWSPRAMQLQSEGVELTRDLRYLLSKSYGTPSEDDLPLEEAREIAKNTLLNLLGWNEEVLMYYGTREAYYTGSPNQYCIVYTILEADSEIRHEADDLNYEKKIPLSVRVCMNAKTGEVTEIYQNDSNWDSPDRLGI